MKIHVLGTGDAYATDRANSAIWVEHQGYHLLIDCGPTVCQQLWQQSNWQALDTVYFTHLHPDHALGLATLVNRFNSSGRRRPLTIVCHRGKEQRLQQLVEYGFWSDRQNFAVQYLLWDEQDLSLSHELGPFTCRTTTTRHGVLNHSLRLQLANKVMFYSGDGCVTEETAQLIAGADIAFIECQATALPEGAGHSDFSRAKELAQLYPNTAFYLYHIAGSEMEAMTELAATIGNIHIAQEGDLLE